jgi:hypothetical protein
VQTNNMSYVLSDHRPISTLRAYLHVSV